jgi:hypothetical protein
MIRMGRYDTMEAMEADVNEAEKDGGWALRDWHPSNEIVQQRDPSTGVMVSWPVVLFYACFVQIPQPKKASGPMRAL